MSVRVDRRDAVTIVTIDRPEVRNAVDGRTADALREAFEAFVADDAARVAVLYGANRTFCSGADLKALANEPEGAFALTEERGPLGPTRMLLDKPTIAAVEGYAVAGGLELALWCDLRVAARDARFGVLNRRWGVPLMDGGTVRLPRLIGDGRALDLIMTGRLVEAAEALAIGLVNRVVEPGRTLEAALEIAGAIAAHPQTSMLGDRMSAIEQWGMSEADALMNEHSHAMHGLVSGDAIEGAARFGSGAGRHGATSG